MKLFDFRQSVIDLLQSSRRIVLVLMVFFTIVWYFSRRVAAAIESADPGPLTSGEWIFLVADVVVWFLLFAFRPRPSALNERRPFRRSAE